MRVLILSHADVHKALAPDDCREAMEDVLAAHARGQAFMPLRSVMRPPEAAGLMGLMPAWRGPRDAVPSDAEPSSNGDEAHALPEPPPPDKAVFALKSICLMRDNPARGLDAHQGI